MLQTLAKQRDQDDNHSDNHDQENINKRVNVGESKGEELTVIAKQLPQRLDVPMQPTTPLFPSSTDVGSNSKLPEDSLQDIKYFSKRVVLYRGGISTVERAEHTPTGKPVILKCYHRTKMQDKHYHKLDREVRSMVALSGPYVASLYAWFSDAHHVWLVLEYCKGGDLFKTMADHGGRLDEHYVCVEIIAPLLRVLEKCSALQLIHRDIKPENIFLTKMYKLKIGDWGLATNHAEEIPFSRSGTLDYMSPEVLKNPVTQLQEGPGVHPAILAAKNIKPYTDKVDVWAAGVLAYELIVGKPPFEVESESQTAHLIMHSKDILFPPQHSRLWADFVRCALIKDPIERPSAQQLMSHAWITHNLQEALETAAASGRKSSKSMLLQALPLPPANSLLPPHQICPPRPQHPSHAPAHAPAPVHACPPVLAPPYVCPPTSPNASTCTTIVSHARNVPKHQAGACGSRATGMARLSSSKSMVIAQAGPNITGAATQGLHTLPSVAPPNSPVYDVLADCHDATQHSSQDQQRLSVWQQQAAVQQQQQHQVLEDHWRSEGQKQPFMWQQQATEQHQQQAPAQAARQLQAGKEPCTPTKPLTEEAFMPATPYAHLTAVTQPQQLGGRANPLVDEHCGNSQYHMPPTFSSQLPQQIGGNHSIVLPTSPMDGWADMLRSLALCTDLNLGVQQIPPSSMHVVAPVTPGRPEPVVRVCEGGDTPTKGQHAQPMAAGMLPRGSLLTHQQQAQQHEAWAQGMLYAHQSQEERQAVVDMRWHWDGAPKLQSPSSPLPHSASPTLATPNLQRPAPHMYKPQPLDMPNNSLGAIQPTAPHTVSPRARMALDFNQCSKPAALGGPAAGPHVPLTQQQQASPHPLALAPYQQYQLHQPGQPTPACPAPYHQQPQCTLQMKRPIPKCPSLAVPRSPGHPLSPAKLLPQRSPLSRSSSSNSNASNRSGFSAASVSGHVVQSSSGSCSSTGRSSVSGGSETFMNPGNCAPFSSSSKHGLGSWSSAVKQATSTADALSCTIHGRFEDRC